MIKLIITIAIVAVIEFSNEFFVSRKDNKTLSRIYSALKAIAWTITAIVTALLYWTGTGYLKEQDYKSGIMLIVFGVLMTASLLGKWYISAKNSDK